jgi:hypothetical protein
MNTIHEQATTETTESATQSDASADSQHTKGVRPETDYVVEEAVGALARIGLLWARHGIGIGRSALEASAMTLRTTAEVLRSVSDRLEVEETPARSTENR